MQKDVLVAALEVLERAAQGVLRPALGIGLFAIDEEAEEGGGEIGDEDSEMIVFREPRGFGYEEVAAIGEGFFDEDDADGIKGEAAQSFQALPSVRQMRDAPRYARPERKMRDKSIAAEDGVAGRAAEVQKG